MYPYSNTWKSSYSSSIVGCHGMLSQSRGFLHPFLQLLTLFAQDAMPGVQIDSHCLLAWVSQHPTYDVVLTTYRLAICWSLTIIYVCTGVWTQSQFAKGTRYRYIVWLIQPRKQDATRADRVALWCQRITPILCTIDIIAYSQRRHTCRIHECTS